MSKPEVFVYCRGPIDDWDEWLTLDLLPISQERWHELWFKLATAAAARGWDQGISAGPYFLHLPTGRHEKPLIAVGWKGAGNGLTYIGSTVELPWVGKQW